MLHVPWEKGDFSAPQRFRRNDDRGAANTVISSGAACRYGADGKRAHDALSREISRRNATCTIRGGDFSTPQRFGRNDGDGGSVFVIRPPYEMTVCCSPTPSSRAGLRVGMGQMENALMIL